MIWFLIGLAGLSILIGCAFGVALGGEFSERTAWVIAVLAVVAIVTTVSPLWSMSTGELLR